jgi:membrane-bound metal-dependent hydrolase YbcI (DUF457 family)
MVLKKIIIQGIIFLLISQIVAFLIYYIFNERYFIHLLFGAFIGLILVNVKKEK